MNGDHRFMTIGLATCKGLERAMLRRVFKDGSDIEKLWHSPMEVLSSGIRYPAQVAQRIEAWRKKIGHSNIEDILESKGISCLLRDDAAYPKGLLDLSDPPVVLFAVGDVHAQVETSVAIVGTRRASGYGLEAAQWMAETIAGAGCTVVSGLALGIDGAAHKGALKVSGRTNAVMACGPDLCYPPTHKPLWTNIQERGVIYSEYAPGTPVAKYRFPERNRLIAGLAKVVVVVQAGERSGALGTVESALELGRDVYAVPGPITSVHFRGSHRLLQDGAHVLLDPQDLLRDLDVSGVPSLPVSVPDRWLDLYEGTTNAITAPVLAQTLRLPVSHVYAGLLELELLGVMERVPGGAYRRKTSPT